MVPTKELGVQTVMLIWRLLGGSTTASTGTPGDAANMWSYTGPRGVLVRGMFDEADIERTRTGGWLEGVTIVVGSHGNPLLALLPSASVPCDGFVAPVQVGTPAALCGAIAEGLIPLECVDQAGSTL